MSLNLPLMDPETERFDEINESLALIQKKNGLTFGTDSYLLAAYLRDMHRDDAIEFGGGTGVVSLLAQSHRKFRQVHCVELQPAFADLIERNVRLNRMESSVLPICADVRDLTPERFGGPVGAVFSNPPYMRSASGFHNETEEMNFARREENGTITDFCASAARLLRFGGLFTVVYRPDRLADLFCAMSEAGLEPKRATLVYPSVSDPPCLVLAEAKKGAASGMFFSPPLIIYENKSDGVYTDAMRIVYDTFSFRHLL